MANLVIKDEKYTIDVGTEQYSLDYPSFEQAIEISKEFNGLDAEESINKMKDWMMKLGLNEKFFGLKGVKSHHIMQVWTEVNAVKK